MITEKEFKYISQDIINKHRLNTVAWMGPTMELVNNFQPETKEQWQEQYLDWANETGQGEKLEELIDVALSLAPQFSRQDIKDVLKVRLIDDVFKGRRSEIDSLNFLSALGPNHTVEHADYELDRYYGVDLLVKKDGVIQFGVQVKSNLYFIGNHPSLLRDKQINEDKYIKCRMEKKFSVYEWCYDNHREGQNKLILDKIKEM